MKPLFSNSSGEGTRIRNSTQVDLISYCCIGDSPPPRGTPVFKRRGYSAYRLGVKKTLLASLRAFSLKRPTAEASVVPLRVLSLKCTTGDNGLFENCYRLGVKKITSHAHKTGSWYLLGGVFHLQKIRKFSIGNFCLRKARSICHKSHSREARPLNRPRKAWNW